ncbi:hypothetical protein JOY44_20185 [Phormidium sp. CLA17]|uniref:hypothetical protein n=1 Tax=Leptolyngbya sp. Cla-17 TaxID=2803751 RepID=UPI001490C5EF|nr:hypothetical protein [Leptolyngbya sp. Cla-17]MBM0743911.1 hypothetical protein [Leptolyngbya sp. Cla-17]
MGFTQVWFFQRYHRRGLAWAIALARTAHLSGELNVNLQVAVKAKQRSRLFRVNILPTA